MTDKTEHRTEKVLGPRNSGPVDRPTVRELAAEVFTEPAEGPIILPPVEAAYVTMVEGEYRAAVLNAQQVRAARFAVVSKAHGIVDGSAITVLPAEDGRPMQLVVTPPAANSGANNGTA